MIALIGFVFAMVAFVRSLRERLLLVAAAMLVVGYGHVLALVSSIDASSASGNPVAVLGLLVLGRMATPHEGESALVLGSLVGRYPLAASAVFVLVSAVAFASVAFRARRMHPETADAQRLIALTNALLALALVDGLLFAIGLLARALLRD
jgi:hypothetical protein